MKKIIFLFFVLFSTLAPSEAGAIISHHTEIAPSVKKTVQTKKELNGIAYVFMGAALICIILSLTIFTVPLAKLLMSLVGLGFAVFGLIYAIKANKAA